MQTLDICHALCPLWRWWHPVGPLRSSGVVSDYTGQQLDQLLYLALIPLHNSFQGCPCLADCVGMLYRHTSHLCFRSVCYTSFN